MNHLVTLIVLCLPFVVVGNDCVITIKNGTIIGTTGDTLNPSKKVCEYVGIPFARAPVGPLRFKPPQPAKVFGILNATKFPNFCPQSTSPPSGVTISEDCLYLNVYQPKIRNVADSNLPVMVWFHPGGFTAGSSMSYTPIKLLARGDVVLVVSHYRVGILGFLTTGDEIAPGNYGLKDQACAIRWINENIRSFGGNTRQVTIFGESAGGASVIYQMLSPMNKGFIHGVISQSGSALSMWAIDGTPVESGKRMAKLVGCPTMSTGLMISCLRKVHWEKFVQVQTDFTNDCYRNLSYAFSGMAPVVEIPHDGAFISKHPLELLKSGEVPNIPVIIGSNKHDGSFILATLYQARFGPDKLDKDPDYMRDQIVPDLMRFFLIQDDESNRAVSTNAEMSFLTGVNRSSWAESMPGLVNLMSVYAFKSSILHTAELLSKRGLKVYLYSFEHHSLNSLWKLSFDSNSTTVEGGVCHADDLIYLFNLPAKFSPEDQTFSDIFCDMWINFGSFGNPTPFPSLRYEKWLPYNTEDELYMKLNITPTVQSGYKLSWRPNGFEWN